MTHVQFNVNDNAIPVFPLRICPHSPSFLLQTGHIPTDPVKGNNQSPWDA